MDSFCEEVKDHRRRRCRPQEDRSTASVENLPRDIVLDILSRLPISSLVQFRCVSRAWRSIAQDPQLANMHIPATARNHHDPCLIFHCDYPIQNQLSFVDHFDSNTRVRKFGIPFLREMPEFDVVGSCNGLLCLSNSLYRDSMYVYNPFTKDYKELPKSMQYPYQEEVFGFGLSPATNKYKVVRIVYYRNGPVGFIAARRIRYSQSQVQILTVGSSSHWRSMGAAPYQFDQRSSAALVDGRLHWVTRRRWIHGALTRNIVSFDLADERFREVPKPDCGGLNRWNFYLLVLAGRLSAAVCCSSNGKLEIWVLKEYGAKESWIKEFNIGAYLPKELKQDALWPPMASKYALNGKVARVLCLLKNGKILLEYRSRALVYYDPGCKRFEELALEGLPKWFQTIVHVGSLNQIDNPNHHT